MLARLDQPALPKETIRTMVGKGMANLVRRALAAAQGAPPSPADEARALAPYFTNTDRPVFALINLPETVKCALFARYSRSAKSLRRLFLDEFRCQVPLQEAASDRDPVTATRVGTDTAE